MIVLAASGIKSGFAMWAGIVGSHIIGDGQFITANSTKNSFLVKFCFWPDFMFMISFFFMTGKAGIILVAAFEFDRYDIQLGMPVHTASLVVHRLTKHIDSSDLGNF